MFTVRRSICLSLSRSAYRLSLIAFSTLAGGSFGKPFAPQIKPINSERVASALSWLCMELRMFTLVSRRSSAAAGCSVCDSSCGPFSVTITPNASPTANHSSRIVNVRIFKNQSALERLLSSLPAFHEQVSKTNDDHDDRNHQHPVYSHCVLHMSVAAHTTVKSGLNDVRLCATKLQTVELFFL